MSNTSRHQGFKKNENGGKGKIGLYYTGNQISAKRTDGLKTLGDCLSQSGQPLGYTTCLLLTKKKKKEKKGLTLTTTQSLGLTP